MNKNVLRILIPIVAILVIIESIILLTNRATITSVVPNNLETQPTEIKSEVIAPITLQLNIDAANAKVGVNGELPLTIVSDKDLSIDAIDLYIAYEPSKVTVNEIVNGQGFVAPSFKKVSPDKGLVVMNFLISEASGYKLKKGVVTEIAKLKVKYTEDGETMFSVGDGTLMVENASAKVLPFNSNKLVINVTK
ncbi:MAG: cohesin domain-containing protein [Candidatus Shapirobacteria bacterium]